MRYILRLTGAQHKILENGLFPSDGKEAGALLLCGRRTGHERHVLTVSKVHLIPLNRCERYDDRLTWPVDEALPFIGEAAQRGLSIVKIHSHPGGYARFSTMDDEADRSFLGSVHNWVDDGLPHASAVILPGGRIFARAVCPKGSFYPFELVSVAGDDIHFWHTEHDYQLPEFVLRNAQAFGKGTIKRLQRLTIAVVGVSGTGSPLIAELARSGVGRLVLVDPDVIEEKNLNRIAFSTMADVGRPKVDVIKDAIDKLGLGVEVIAIQKRLEHPDVVRAVAECDLAYGCMDSVSGRDFLNRVATFYNLPYFDVGVALRSRTHGGIDTISVGIHYLQPGLSSLRSRGVYDSEDVRAEIMKRSAPGEYERQRAEKYIRGVQEDRPTVMPINAFAASMAAMELLARLHLYRFEPNSAYAEQIVALHDAAWSKRSEGTLPRCEILQPFVGRGDTIPLLGKPELSELVKAA